MACACMCVGIHACVYICVCAHRLVRMVRWTMYTRADMLCLNYALCDDAMDDVAVQYYVLFAYFVVVY